MKTMVKPTGPKPQDYVGIWVWGKQSGSAVSYIKWQQEKAADAGAPLDAVYEIYTSSGPSGKWACVSDLREDHPFRESYNAAMAMLDS